MVGSGLSGWSTFPFIILKNERQYTEVCILRRKNSWKVKCKIAEREGIMNNSEDLVFGGVEIECR